MKKYFKETWYVYTIVFAFCFMLFLCEPLTMFLNNPTDFWFSFSLIFKMSSLLFLVVVAILIIIFNIIYFLNKNKSKKIFKVSAIIMFIIFLCSYIQGNFLVGNLPVLDGTEIVWSSYTLDWIISIVLWIIVIVGTIFAIKKLSLNKVVKYSGFISMAITVMLLLSFTTTIISNSKSLNKEITPLVTYKSINNYSSDKNFIILLLDCVDSIIFNERLKADKDFKDIFNDFTYYPDMMSGHPFTTESIPLVLTGKYYQNEEPINEWATKAYTDSSLFKLIEDNEYELNVYESNLLYNDDSVNKINNIYDSKKAEKEVNIIKFWKQEVKDILFRYLPFPVKSFSKVEKMNFTILFLQDKVLSLEDSFFNPDNYEMIKLIRENKLQITENNNFKFIHLEGAHTPWRYNKKYKRRSTATYENEIDSCLTLVKEYLNMLKKNNFYDNSAIIIMADHGFATDKNGNQRMNPIFFVKGVDEKHKGMQTSNKPVHFIDLEELYSDLISGKKDKELFSNISKTRTRRFLSYKINNKDYMEEYTTGGMVRDVEKYKKTGVVYKAN